MTDFPPTRTYVLTVRCAATPEFRDQNRDDASLFNAALVVASRRTSRTTRAQQSASVPVVAADLANFSEWFALYVKRRHTMRATNSDLRSVEVPADIDIDTLEQVIAAMYSGRIELGPANLQQVLLAARSMLMPVIEDPCKRYIRDSLVGSSEAWAASLYSMTTRLSMDDMTEVVIVHMVEAALAPYSGTVALYSALAALDSTEEQLRLLKAGISSRTGCDRWSHAILAVLLMRLDQFGTRQLASTSRKRARTSAAAGSSGTAAAAVCSDGAALDVAALLDHVDWDSLHTYEVKALSRQALSCERHTTAAAAFSRALLQQASERLDGGSDTQSAPPYFVGRLQVAALSVQDATKVRLTGHLQMAAVAGAAPIILRVWRSSTAKPWYVSMISPSGTLLRNAKVTSGVVFALGPTLHNGCYLGSQKSVDRDTNLWGRTGLLESLVKRNYALGQHLVFGVLPKAGATSNVA